jgi:CheY-like chemotaxis protein
VKDYIKKMHGEIYVESEMGTGSMFTCVLPFEKPILDNDNDVIETNYTEKITKNDLPHLEKRIDKIKSSISTNDRIIKYRALLIEDDQLAQNMGILILKGIGYQVDLAKSGEEALKLIETTHYDLIYTDIGLPGIDGIETVRRIRASQNPSKNAFITALTAHADEEITKQCLQVGMQQVIPKPLSPEKAQQINILITQPKALMAIDFDLWKSRLDSNAHMLDQLFHMLAEDFSTTKSAIIKAYEDHDLATLKAVTHKMKGGLKYCGLPRLETAIISIESAAKNKDEVGVNRWYQETLDALDEATQVYNEWAIAHPKT